jgi:hypothetical protein
VLLEPLIEVERIIYGSPAFFEEAEMLSVVQEHVNYVIGNLKPFVIENRHGEVLD